MAPQRTVNDAAFWWQDKDGVTNYARRGDTIDIPEGPDLERGDKHGAFTKVVGEEPAPPEGSEIPNIEPEWSNVEFDRFVDAGNVNEILGRLDEVSPELRSTIATKLADAEGRRKDGARSTLLDALTRVVEPGPGSAAPPESPEHVAAQESAAKAAEEAAANDKKSTEKKTTK